MNGQVRELAGRYRLGELLSRGGMGEVWRGYDTRLGRPVAVKLLTAGLADPTDSRRFFREARLAAQLSHHNVVAVYDVGEWDGRPYLVMELLDGATLADILEQTGPLPGSRVCDIGAQIADGLGAAHALGVIHRDVKPSNLMSTPDGTVKVVDFGIARLADDAATRLTRTGLVIGTAAYVAPEQLTGGTTDERSDLYAVGCVLYELLTGRPPFEGGLAALAYSHVHDEPPRPSARGATLSPELEALLLSLLAKDPAHRPQSAAALAGELHRLAASEAAAEARTARLPGRPGSRGPGTQVMRAGSRGPDTGVLPAARDPRQALIPVLVGVVAVMAVALAAGLLWLGSEGRNGNRPSGAAPLPSSSRSEAPALPQAPTPQASAGPEESQVPEYGSEAWLRSLDGDLEELIGSGVLDEDAADELSETINEAIEARAKGESDRARKKLAELGRELRKQTRKAGEIPLDGLLGSVLERELGRGWNDD